MARGCQKCVRLRVGGRAFWHTVYEGEGDSVDGEGRERVWEVEHSEVKVYEDAMPLTLPRPRRLLSAVERPEDLQKFEETNLDAADWRAPGKRIYEKNRPCSAFGNCQK